MKNFRAVLSRAGARESLEKESAGSRNHVLCADLVFTHKSNKELVIGKGTYGEFESVFFARIYFIIKIVLSLVGTIHGMYCYTILFT